MAILEAEFTPEPTPENDGELLYGQIPEPLQLLEHPERHLHLVEPVEAEPELVAAQGAIRSTNKEKKARELKDLQLAVAAQKGDEVAMDDLIRRYTAFVRRKATSYFIAGGDWDDVAQEGLIGLYKAARDYDPAKETSFRSFAELCITRQIITAVKTARRYKRSPLNDYVSFSHTPANQEHTNLTLGEALPGPEINDPAVIVISTEELQALVGVLSAKLTPLESDVLRLYMEGNTYDQMAEELGINFKSVDNAFQRVKRKVLSFQESRVVLQ